MNSKIYLFSKKFFLGFFVGVSLTSILISLYSYALLNNPNELSQKLSLEELKQVFWMIKNWPTGAILAGIIGGIVNIVNS